MEPNSVARSDEYKKPHASKGSGGLELATGQRIPFTLREGCYGGGVTQVEADTIKKLCSVLEQRGHGPYSEVAMMRVCVSVWCGPTRTHTHTQAHRG